MSTALVAPAQVGAFTREQIELIKRTVAKGASDDELRMFLAQAERTGLDPFDRQIYFIKRKQWDKGSGTYTEVGQTQVSIDGLRVVAERTGEMDGQDIHWCAADGQWRDVWLEKAPPAAARVIVYRKGCTHGFPAVARFDEYAQATKDGKLTGMWQKMAALMVAKCAEALAMRKAFPRQLSGLYTRDEMAQAETVPSPAPLATAPVPATMPTSPVRAALPAPETPLPALVIEADAVDADAPVTIVKLEEGKTPKGKLTKWTLVLSNGLEVQTINERIATLADQIRVEGTPITLTTKDTPWGTDVIELHRAVAPEPSLPLEAIPFAEIAHEPGDDDDRVF